MRLANIIIAMAMSATIGLTTNYVFAGNNDSIQKAENDLQKLDENQGEGIVNEELNDAEDESDDNAVPDEWQKYHFKSLNRNEWLRNSGDVLLKDRSKFSDNFRR